MKILLHKFVAIHLLSFEALSTILTEVEAILNSKPLVPLEATNGEGYTALTPVHFLIGRPLKAPPPTRVDLDSKLTLLKR